MRLPINGPSPEVRPKQIRILNPSVSTDRSWTGFNRAARLVKSKRAVWVDSRTIEFTALGDIAERQARLADERARQINYDAINREMTLEELRHIPVVMPSKLLRA